MVLSHTASLAELLERYDVENGWPRQFVPSEEEKLWFSLPRSTDGYRSFAASNVVCIEKARRLRRLAQ